MMLPLPYFTVWNDVSFANLPLLFSQYENGFKTKLKNFSFTRLLDMSPEISLFLCEFTNRILAFYAAFEVMTSFSLSGF